MRVVALLAALVAVAGSVALSGCGDPGREYTVGDQSDSVAVLGDNEPGSGDTDTRQREEIPPEPETYHLAVTVREAGGAPLAGAAVVFDGPWGETEAAIADGEGRVDAYFLGEDEATIVVGGLDGFTTETVESFVLGDPGTSDDLEVALYRTGANMTLLVSFVGPVLPSGAEAPLPLVFSADPDAQRGYVERLSGISGTLAWVNGPEAMAQLAVSVGPEGAEPTWSSARFLDPPMPGAQQVEVELDEEEAGRARDAALAGGGGLQVAVGVSGLPGHAVASLDATLSLEFRFHGSDDSIEVV